MLLLMEGKCGGYGGSVKVGRIWFFCGMNRLMVCRLGDVLKEGIVVGWDRIKFSFFIASESSGILNLALLVLFTV